MPGQIYNTALLNFRRLRQLKNRMLNLIDPPVVVLIYHRITKLSDDRRLLAVSPDNFRAHMQYLKQNFRIIRFEESWAGLREPAVAITFDDGYADNVLEALPILENIGVPATFFVTTGTIGTRHEFSWDELERIILGQTDYPAQFTYQYDHHEKGWPTATSQQRQAMYSDLLPLIQRLPSKQREEWLGDLRKWAGLNQEGRKANRPLTHDELRLLGQNRWATIGAHTVTHTPLSALSADEQRSEILSSRQYLEDFLGKEITVFSYPFGEKRDYNTHSVRICREAGFIRAAANFPGQTHRWTDPFQIPRQLVRNWDKDSFAKAMRSFWI
jgi:peptidoglycan/xylan/chitin deacetylase (PgdA/CDA1 family)